MLKIARAAKVLRFIRILRWNKFVKNCYVLAKHFDEEMVENFQEALTNKHIRNAIT